MFFDFFILWSFLSSARLFLTSFYILSHEFVDVKNFFQILFTAVVEISTVSALCDSLLILSFTGLLVKHFFKFFLIVMTAFQNDSLYIISLLIRFVKNFFILSMSFQVTTCIYYHLCNLLSTIISQ